MRSLFNVKKIAILCLFTFIVGGVFGGITYRKFFDNDGSGTISEVTDEQQPNTELYDSILAGFERDEQIYIELTGLIEDIRSKQRTVADFDIGTGIIIDENERLLEELDRRFREREIK